jgi:RNA-binding protein Musashi
MTGRSRGFAFLTFQDPSSVEKVLQQDHIVDDKKVFNSINSQIDPKRAVPKGGHVDQTDPKIFVGSLGQDIVEADLIEYFAQFGEVKGAKIMFDKVTRQSRGFGFVFFERVETAIHVLEMNASAEIKGRTVIWNWSLLLD